MSSRSPTTRSTPAMQERYYNPSPYNLIRIMLGKHQPDDTEETQRLHPRRGDTEEVARGAHPREENEPALYGYSQTYTVPGTGGTESRRRFANGAASSRSASSTTTPTRSSTATSRRFRSTSPTAWRSSRRRARTASRSTCSTPTRRSRPSSSSSSAAQRSGRLEDGPHVTRARPRHHR